MLRGVDPDFSRNIADFLAQTTTIGVISRYLGRDSHADWKYFSFRDLNSDPASLFFDVGSRLEAAAKG